MSDALRAQVQQARQLVPRGAINVVEWDSATAALTVHTALEAVSIESQLNAAISLAPVKVVTDRFSADELNAEAARLTSESGYNITSVSPRSDYSGLEVTMLAANPGARQAPPTSSIPLSITVTDENPAEATSRNLDSSPFWGGGLMTRTTGDRYTTCSVAFPVETSFTGGRARAMVTADHCGSTGEVWKTGEPGAGGGTIGKLESGNSGGGSDFRLLSAQGLSGVDYQGVVFWGGIGTSDGIPVEGWFDSAVGDVRVDRSPVPRATSRSPRSTSRSASTGSLTATTTSSRRRAPTVARCGGSGDSGGPVLAGSSGGSVVGGVISGADTNASVPCRGVPASETRTCTTKGWYANARAFFENNPGWYPLSYQ
ncbi:hypothetical protein [Curtobacterium sp. MCPF17_052]|uniref:hypothetical protein n=1 Tax=Curtobacterium sp. MCPF17_052 TaxID=2175655 RepID=UPI0024E03A48|nr:hypothetical protein [Curtobacterium sp. MCPF17_052]WIB11416.1 hypothetical protein DEJ36_10340 [Curtobacterium sp. MCPF17_052]